MSISVAKIKKSLNNKGFREIEGGKHKKWFFFFNGKRTSSYLIISRTPKMKDFDDTLLPCAKSELKLKTNTEVKELFNCPMKEKIFIQKLIEYGVIQEENN